jgi:phage FluMu protein gp41
MKKLLPVFIAFSCIFLQMPALAQEGEGGSTSSSVSKNNLSKNNQNNVVLESLGGFTAMAMYNTYATVGMAADAHVKGTYEEQMVVQLLEEQITFIDNVNAQTNKLIKSGKLSATDLTFFKDVVNTFNFIKAEAKAYQNYMESGDASHATSFNTNREKAWAKITELLGIGN